MNYVFDLYGTLIDIWTDESREELWEGVASLLGDGEECAETVKNEYMTLCREAKRGESHEINLLAVFESMLARRGVTTDVAPDLALEFRRMSMVYIRTFRGVKTMLRDLRKVGGVYLLSNAQSCFTVDELKTCGLYDLFDGIIISSDVGTKKPWGEIFDIAFDRFGITPENSIYVGNDMRDDVLGASSKGMRTLYIETAQSGSYPHLDLPKPTFVVKNHAEMKERLISLST
jgi:putative hydrolase of the HAD superfamily